MIEPLIRWLITLEKGYDIASYDLKLANKWYTGDGTLVTNSFEDLIALLNIVQQFSIRSGIHLHADKCKIAAYIQALQTIPRKQDRDDALRARLAHIALASCPVGSLTLDEPLLGDYLGTALTAFLSPEAHLH